MVAEAKLLKQNFTVSKEIGRSTGVELYHVYGLTGWTPANTTSVVLPLAGPAEGNPHPDPGLPGALVRGKRLMQVLDPTQAIVAVIYDSAVRFSGGPRGGMTASTRSIDITLPAYVRPDPTVTIWTKNPEAPPYIRVGINRTEERYTTGDEDELIDEIAPNQNKRYTLGGLPYLLMGADVAKARTGQIRLVYHFTTKGPVPGVSASPGSGVELAIPTLGYLEEYVMGGTSDAPEIKVRPATFYTEGAELPAF